MSSSAERRATTLSRCLDLARKKRGRKLENARLIVMRADIQTDVACVTEADQDNLADG
jgi:hypothetical protein